MAPAGSSSSCIGEHVTLVAAIEDPRGLNSSWDLHGDSYTMSNWLRRVGSCVKVVRDSTAWTIAFQQTAGTKTCTIPSQYRCLITIPFRSVDSARHVGLMQPALSPQVRAYLDASFSGLAEVAMFMIDRQHAHR